MFDLIHWYSLVHNSNDIVCFSLDYFQPRLQEFDHFSTISNTKTLNLDKGKRPREVEYRDRRSGKRGDDMENLLLFVILTVRREYIVLTFMCNCKISNHYNRIYKEGRKNVHSISRTPYIYHYRGFLCNTVCWLLMLSSVYVGNRHSI